MVEIGREWVENYRNWSNMVEVGGAWSKLVANWSEMIGIGQTWSKLVERGRSWSTISRKWSQLVKHGRSWCTHGYHHPRPTPTANTIVLKWDSNGRVDLSPLNEYGFDEEVDGRRVVKTWCQAICPVTNMSKWSWKMQMSDLFGVLLKTDMSFFVLNTALNVINEWNAMELMNE